VTEETSDPEQEIGLEEAAKVLGFSVAHVIELLNNGAIAFRTGEPVLIRRGDVETWRREFERQRAAIEAMARIVDESPGGWDLGWDE
jgi:excisionase family DNA binding protein